MIDHVLVGLCAVEAAVDCGFVGPDSLPDELVDVLLLPLLAAKRPDELLSTNTAGQWLSSSRFWTSTWTPALDAACPPVKPDGSPDPDAPRLTKRPRVHDLRHTHASWMLAAGTDLFVLQRRLGHDSTPRRRRRTPT